MDDHVPKAADIRKADGKGGAAAGDPQGFHQIRLNGEPGGAVFQLFVDFF